MHFRCTKKVNLILKMRNWCTENSFKPFLVEIWCTKKVDLILKVRNWYTENSFKSF